MNNIALILKLSLPISLLSELFGYYVFSDWEFLKFLVVLVILDTVLGFIKHWIEHDISSKAYGMIGRKLIVYSAVLILANVVSHYKIDGNPQTTLQWFGTFCCTALMIREALSIIENVEAISPGFFPKSIIRRLSDFNSVTGNKIKEHEQNQ